MDPEGQLLLMQHKNFHCWEVRYDELNMLQIWFELPGCSAQKYAYLGKKGRKTRKFDWGGNEAARETLEKHPSKNQGRNTSWKRLSCEQWNYALLLESRCTTFNPFCGKQVSPVFSWGGNQTQKELQSDICMALFLFCSLYNSTHLQLQCLFDVQSRML